MMDGMNPGIEGGFTAAFSATGFLDIFSRCQRPLADSVAIVENPKFRDFGVNPKKLTRKPDSDFSERVTETSLVVSDSLDDEFKRIFLFTNKRTRRQRITKTSCCPRTILQPSIKSPIALSPTILRCRHLSTSIWIRGGICQFWARDDKVAEYPKCKWKRNSEI